MAGERELSGEAGAVCGGLRGLPLLSELSEGVQGEPAPPQLRGEGAPEPCPAEKSRSWRRDEAVGFTVLRCRGVSVCPVC